MDKLAIGLIADILYMKKIICFEELEALLDAKSPTDIYAFQERLLRGDFNVYRKGEHYDLENSFSK